MYAGVYRMLCTGTDKRCYATKTLLRISATPRVQRGDSWEVGPLTHCTGLNHCTYGRRDGEWSRTMTLISDVTLYFFLWMMYS